MDNPLAESSNEAQGQVVTYGYDGLWELTRATWGAGTADALTATFGYSGTHLVTITTPYTGATRAWSMGAPQDCDTRPGPTGPWQATDPQGSGGAAGRSDETARIDPTQTS